MSARHRPAQFNVRSDFLRQRVPEIVTQTGMTATQVLEEAVRAFHPAQEVLPPGLERRGWLLVASTGGSPISLEQINAAIEADRSGVRD